MGRLQHWWQTLTGTRGGAAQPKPSKPAAPQAGRTRQRGQAENPAGLSLAEDAPAAKPSRIRGAGFDPYANDAGYAKPRSWERLDHD